MTIPQLIPIVATLLGTVIGTVLGSAFRNRADSAGRVHEWQVSVVGIYGDLMSALSSHYAAMWDLEAARIRNDGTGEVDTALQTTLSTRDAVTRPHAQLVVLAPLLRPQIDRAVNAVYAMDTFLLDQAERTEQRLTAQRHAAKDAMANLRAEMASVMTRLGAGLPVNTSRRTLRLTRT